MVRQIENLGRRAIRLESLYPQLSRLRIGRHRKARVLVDHGVDRPGKIGDLAEGIAVHQSVAAVARDAAFLARFKGFSEPMVGRRRGRFQDGGTAFQAFYHAPFAALGADEGEYCRQRNRSFREHIVRLVIVPAGLDHAAQQMYRRDAPSGKCLRLVDQPIQIDRQGHAAHQRRLIDGNGESARCHGLDDAGKSGPCHIIIVAGRA